MIDQPRIARASAMPVLAFPRMMRMLLPVLALPVSACVPTVAYSPSPSGPESAQRALVAERNLTHGQARVARESDPDHAPMSFCTTGGLLVEVVRTRVADGGVCGQEIRFSVTGTSTIEPERCWRYAEIATIGQPRDATGFGYFPVRGHLRCPGPR